MAPHQKAIVKVTHRALAQLDALQVHWEEQGVPQAFEGFLDELEQHIIPKLMAFPEVGRPLFGPPSPETPHTRRSTEAIPVGWRGA